MKGSILLKLSVCVLSVSAGLYTHLEEQNELTQIRMQVPKLENELLAIEEFNTRLRFEIEKFESPVHLMELANQCEFSHLRHPYADDVLVVAVDGAIGEASKEKFSVEEPLPLDKRAAPTIILGAQ